MKQLKLHICTWNVGRSNPLDVEDILKLLQVNSNESADLYAIGLQEIKSAVVATASAILKIRRLELDEWSKKFILTLSAHGYYLVESVRVQGISLSLFARLSHLPFIRFIKSDIERTGIGSIWGNKGGVTISASVYNQTVCFLNSHLAANRDENRERVNDIREIFEEIDFGKNLSILSHDVVFWFGDLNFRIDKYSREDVIQMTEEKKYDQMLLNDQLKKLYLRKCIVSEFTEGLIEFPPSYKFDVGTDIYDTSSKRRVPAWTDRILFRVNRHQKSLKSAVARALLLLTLRPRGPLIHAEVHPVDGSYTSHVEFRASDHKPVSAQFVLKVPTKEVLLPLVTLDVQGKWKSESRGAVKVTFRESIKPKHRDYLALYEGTFSSVQSYAAWTYVHEIKGKSVEISHVFKFPVPEIKSISQYVVGYYSHSMSCLLALSEPFEIVK